MQPTSAPPSDNSTQPHHSTRPTLPRTAPQTSVATTQPNAPENVTLSEQPQPTPHHWPIPEPEKPPSPPRSHALMSLKPSSTPSPTHTRTESSPDSRSIILLRKPNPAPRSSPKSSAPLFAMHSSSELPQTPVENQKVQILHEEVQDQKSRR